MNNTEAGARLAALINEIEAAGLDVYTIGTSIWIGSSFRVTEGTREGDPWIAEDMTAELAANEARRASRKRRR